MSETENNLEQRDDQLNKQMATHPAEESIQVLVKDAKRRSFQLRLLTVTVIVNLLLILGLSIVSYKLYQITKLAQNNRDAIISNCETANDSRRNQRELWRYIISLPPTQPRSDEQEARVVEFNKFIEKTFVQRDCQAEAIKVAK